LEYWRGTIDILMGYAQVPPVWAELANCEKRERITILQTAFWRFSRRENLSTPRATAELTNIVINLQFLSPDDEKLDLGLQPFAVARSLLYKAYRTYFVDDFNRISNRLADLHEEQPHQSE
jgi:hypothetical protein